MREAGFVQARLFNSDQIKQLNEAVSKNLVSSHDKPSEGAIKSSQVKFVRLFSIQKLIFPFIDFIMTTNHHHYGFDLFPLTPSKILNYNSYKIDEEYSWHMDGTIESPVRDIKLTCLLNCSEENYQGGDLFIFREGEKKVENFSPGSAVIFPSFTYHKVEKIVSGSRKTLAIWMDGPKFR